MTICHDRHRRVSASEEANIENRKSWDNEKENENDQLSKNDETSKDGKQQQQDTSCEDKIPTYITGGECSVQMTKPYLL